MQNKIMCAGRNQRLHPSLRSTGAPPGDLASRLAPALAGLSLLGIMGNAAAAAGCQSMMTEHPPIFEMTFDVRGSERIQRKVLLPAGTSVLVFAREQGLDVRLEVKRDDVVIALADNPIFRTGTQPCVVVFLGGPRVG